MMKWIDTPPVWLLGMLAFARLSRELWPNRLSFGGPWADLLGGLLVGGGILLAVLAVTELRRNRTSLLPHEIPDRLVTTGIFSRSRNPIYLGDVLILSGMILYWDAVLALPLMPVFFWVLENRFVIPEEAILRRKFRADFARYAQQTRRWF